ncbi:hypothetical protein SRHO_G00213030 [Serrasalmus rhombeus]
MLCQGDLGAGRLVPITSTVINPDSFFLYRRYKRLFSTQDVDLRCTVIPESVKDSEGVGKDCPSQTGRSVSCEDPAFADSCLLVEPLQYT